MTARDTQSVLDAHGAGSGGNAIGFLRSDVSEPPLPIAQCLLIFLESPPNGYRVKPGTTVSSFFRVYCKIKSSFLNAAFKSLCINTLIAVRNFIPDTSGLGGWNDDTQAFGLNRVEDFRTVGSKEAAAGVPGVEPTGRYLRRVLEFFTRFSLEKFLTECRLC